MYQLIKIDILRYICFYVLANLAKTANDWNIITQQIQRISLLIASSLYVVSYMHVSKCTWVHEPAQSPPESR